AIAPPRHVLVWSDRFSNESLPAAGRRLRALLAHPGDGRLAEPLHPSAPGEAVCVRQERWGDFSVERLVDAACSADPRVAEVRVREQAHVRCTQLVNSDASRASRCMSVTTIRLDLWLEDGIRRLSGSATA